MMQRVGLGWMGRGMVLAGLVCWPLLAGVGQIPEASQSSPSPAMSSRPGLPSIGDPSPLGAASAAKLERMREDERRKKLLADTQRLVQLSTELKEEVEKTSKDELSVDVVKKAAELEKLARDVKERMKS